MGRIVGLLGILLITLLLACQEQAAPASVPATPDIPATVEVLVQEQFPTPVPTATPDIDATVEARLTATVMARPTNTAVPTSTPTPTATPASTATPVPTPTPTATPTLIPTATPTAVPTPTPTWFPTWTPRPSFTPTPTRTPRPTNTPLTPLKYDRALLAFGPVGGTLVHEPNDNFVEAEEGPDIKGDLLVEATFLNPYGADNRYWEHGFLLRDGPARNHQYWLSIDSDGFWETFHRLGDTGLLGRYSEETDDIDRRPGGKNLLQVVIIGNRGWIYINGKLQGGMDLSVDTGGDAVTIFTDDEYEGETRFEDFTVWRWSSSLASGFSDLDPNAMPTPTPTRDPKVPIFGPVSGKILHDSKDGFLEEFEGPSIKGDVMVEVTFANPFAPNESHWNYGILFTSRIPETYHHVEVHSTFGGAYNHWRRAGRDDEVRGRLSEDLSGLNLQKDDENHIRLIILGNSGHLYVNERRAGILNFDLGNVQNPDQINLVVADIEVFGYKYDKGGHTKFEDFTVWRWHPSLFDLPDDD